LDFEIFGELARHSGADLWKNRKKTKKSAWTSGKIPLMTKGGSLPCAPAARMRNLEWEMPPGNESLEGRPPCRP
jgi:hypothetical protein